MGDDIKICPLCGGVSYAHMLCCLCMNALHLLFLHTVKGLTNVIEQFHRFDILSVAQVQRYSVANHLLWLAKGMPGGHIKWKFLDTKELNDAYCEKLKELEMCDTLFFVLKKR